MIFLKHVRLSILFSIVLTVIILILSTVLSLIFVEYIQKLGMFMVDVNSNNIRFQTRTFIRKTIDLEVLQYSTLFEQMENYSKVFAKHIGGELDNISGKKEIKNSIMFPMNVYNGDIYYNYDDPYKMILIPKPLKNGLNKKYIDELSVLGITDPLIKNVVSNSISIHNMWIITPDMLTVKYVDQPNTDKNDYINWKNGHETTLRYLREYNELKGMNKSTYWSNTHKSYSGITETSVITPMYGLKGQFLGLVGISVHLEDILNIILGHDRILHYGKKVAYNKSAYNFFSGSFSFIIDKTGKFIAYPANKAPLFSLPPERVEDLYDELYEGNIKSTTNQKISKLASDIIKGKYGEKTLKLDGENYMIIFKELFNSNWFLAIVIPEYDIFASIRETRSLIDKTSNNIVIRVLLITITAIFFFILLNLIFFRKLLLGPLIRLCRETWGISVNNLEASVKKGNTKEINTLAESLNKMSVELNNHIKKFKIETENRKRIEAEVRIAAEVQKSLLPKLNSDFKRKEFVVSAGIHITENASKCSYDIFYLNDDVLVFSVADISQKGIPAAFYMGMVKTLIKEICLSNKQNEPGKVLEEANKVIIELSSNAEMYVNVFIVFYNISNSTLQYANSGNSVGGYYLNDKIKFRLKITGSDALGKYADSVYESRMMKLSEKDKIVLFARELGKNTPEDVVMKTRRDFEKLIMEFNELTCEEFCNSVLEAAKLKKIGPEMETAALVVFEKNMKGS